MISFTCPGCQATFKLPDELAGKPARCSKCDQRFTVPAVAAPAVEAPAAPASSITAKKVALKPVQEVLQAAAAHGTAATGATKPFDDVEVVQVPDKVVVVDDDPPRRRVPASIARDDDYEGPRRRRRRSESGGSTGIVIGSIAGGVVFVAVIVVVIVLLVNRSSRVNQPMVVQIDPAPPGIPQVNPGVGGGPADPVPIVNNPAPAGAVILDRQDRLTVADGFDNLRNGCRAKRYQVQLEANKTYIIDMIDADQFSNLDPYLRLEFNGVNIVEDDDGGGQLNARIVFQPQQTGQYTIVATSCGFQETGSYRLIVRVQ